jgi:hypothetical protein
VSGRPTDLRARGAAPYSIRRIIGEIVAAALDVVGALQALQQALIVVGGAEQEVRLRGAADAFDVADRIEGAETVFSGIRRNTDRFEIEDAIDGVVRQVDSDAGRTAGEFGVAVVRTSSLSVIRRAAVDSRLPFQATEALRRIGTGIATDGCGARPNTISMPPGNPYAKGIGAPSVARSTVTRAFRFPFRNRVSKPESESSVVKSKNALTVTSPIRTCRRLPANKMCLPPRR